MVRRKVITIFWLKQWILRTVGIRRGGQTSILTNKLCFFHVFHVKNKKWSSQAWRIDYNKFHLQCTYLFQTFHLTRWHFVVRGVFQGGQLWLTFMYYLVCICFCNNNQSRFLCKCTLICFLFKNSLYSSIVVRVISKHYYRPQQELQKGNVFISVYHSFCLQVGHAWWRGDMHGEGGTCIVKGAWVVKGGICGKGHALQGRAWQEGMHGRGHVWQGACIAGEGMHGRGHVWQGACIAGGMCGKGVCMAGVMATAVDGTHPTGMHS